MNALRPAVTLTLLMTVVCGLLYPLAMTGVAQALWPYQANGSLVVDQGRVVGSELIAQAFTGERYFHSRPSAAGQGYDATSSGGSNLSVSSRVGNDAIRQRIAEIRGAHTGVVPADLVTASGSGLDPHVSPAAALYQVPRVAAARGLDEERLNALVRSLVESRQLGVLGEPRVNVLRLNRALDALSSP